MRNKVHFDASGLFNFYGAFVERYNDRFHIRKYFDTDGNDVSFEFYFIPNEDMINYIKEYAVSLGGQAIFSGDKTKFDIYEI